MQILKLVSERIFKLPEELVLLTQEPSLPCACTPNCLCFHLLNIPEFTEIVQILKRQVN
jgi:hypothetical protein